MSNPILRLMTASRARSARACRRRHHLQYVLGYRPVQDAEALRFGTLAHLALEAWWKAKQAGKPQEEWLLEAHRVLAERNVDPIDLTKLQVLIAGYHYRWKDENLEVLAVEATFEGPLVNPKTGRSSTTWKLAGKLDVLVRDPELGVLVVEHKTSSEDVSPASDYWRRLRMDGQVSVYFEGARFLGHEVTACRYDVIGKIAQRPAQIPLLDEAGQKIVLDANGERVKTKTGGWRQTGDTAAGYILQTRLETPEEFQARIAALVAETPDKYFARGDVHRLQQDMADALTDVWQLAQSLREEELAGRAPRNPDACMQPGRTCPFLAACAGEASIDNPELFQRVEDVHPELAA